MCVKCDTMYIYLLGEVFKIMTKTQTIHVRISEQLKHEAEVTLRNMGLTTADAINIFLHQVVNSQSIPFAIKAKQPNSETLLAMKEAENLAKELHDGSRKGFSSAAEIFADMGV